ncbi:Hypothetical protein J6899_01940 [Nakaseomyces glabratus]
MLPALNTVMHEEKSPFLTSNFQCDNQGVIRLPPILSQHVARPKSVESCVRYTAIASAMHTPHANYLATPAPKPRLVTVQHTVPSTPAVTPVSATPLATKPKSKKLDNILTPISAVKAAISTPSSDDKKRAFAFITHSQETFPTKEPKIDNAQLARRKRRRTSSQELNILQAEFQRCSTPDKQTRINLAQRCNMTEKAVQVWFQNKRQAMKRHKVIADNRSRSNGSTTSTTPLASRTPSEDFNISTDTSSCDDSESVPQLALPLSTSSPKKAPLSPRPKSPTKKRSQALTFHLDASNKTLTPVKTSPNRRVNRLINNENLTSPSKSKKVTKVKKEPLKSLDVNVKH